VEQNSQYEIERRIPGRPSRTQKKALDRYNEKVRLDFSWEEREKFFTQAVKSYPWLRENVWVRITATGKNLFDKNSKRPSNKLELFRVRRIRWPSIENKTLHPYVQLVDFDGNVIRGEFRASEIIDSGGKNPKAKNFSGTASFIGKKAEESKYRVQFAGMYRL
jgi:hypothetical protein